MMNVRVMCLLDSYACWHVWWIYEGIYIYAVLSASYDSYCSWCILVPMSCTCSLRLL